MNQLVTFPYVSISVEHNPHKLNYETVGDYVDFHNPTWQSNAARAAAFQQQDFWVLQCYPDTPVGFFRIAAPTLEELLEFAEMCGERSEAAE